VPVGEGIPVGDAKTWSQGVQYPGDDENTNVANTKLENIIPTYATSPAAPTTSLSSGCLSAVRDSSADAMVDGAKRPASSAVRADASTQRGWDAEAATVAVAVAVALAEASVNATEATTGRDKRRSTAARISI
jgi:hypothetical protein